MARTNKYPAPCAECGSRVPKNGGALVKEGRAYKGRIKLVNATGSTHAFCKTHARMALEGFVDNDGNVMHPTDRSNYQQGIVSGNPPNMGDWKNTDG